MLVLKKMNSTFILNHNRFAMQGFLQFIREQGIVGLAVGFIIGASVGKVVSSLVTDIIQPLIGLAFGSTEGLTALTFGPVRYGNFLAVLIDFVIVAGVVYWIFRQLKLDKLDLKK